MGEIRRVAQQRKEVAHDGDDGPCLPVAVAAVFDLRERVDHLVDMTPVFGQKQLASCVVVILFHKGFRLIGRIVSGRPRIPYGLFR